MGGILYLNTGYPLGMASEIILLIIMTGCEYIHVLNITFIHIRRAFYRLQSLIVQNSTNRKDWSTYGKNSIPCF